MFRTLQYYYRFSILAGFFLLGFLIELPVLPSITHAQITLDGSLGVSESFTGPDYIISQDLGQTKGTNLFHSFGEFSLQTGESATFTGADTLENIISRVTGGNQSYIDGLLSCTISDANLFLINPAGLMFGPNASLDVKGSFHASSADYLNLSDGGKFYADPIKTSVLTTAPPSAFGFLDGNPAGISIEGSMLQVPEGETLSFVGGNISGQDGTLYAPDGRLNLASAASAGEVIMDDSGLNMGSIETLGEIHIAHSSSSDHVSVHGTTIGNVDVGGETGGSINIIGGRITIDGAYVFSKTHGNLDGNGGINILAGEDINISNDSELNVSTYNSGDGGSISIDTLGTLIVSDSVLYSLAFLSTGNAGDIVLNVNSLTLSDGAQLDTSVKWSIGHGGNLDITATGSVSLSDSDILNTAYFSFGNAGSTTLNVGSLILSDGALLDTSAYFSMGNGGNLGITSAGSVSLSDSDILNTAYLSAGNAGNITFNIGSLTLSEGALLDTSAYYSIGNGGDLDISTTGSITLSDSRLYSSTYYSFGNCGDIMINAGNLSLVEGGSLNTGTVGPGQGGEIVITTADSVLISGENSNGSVSCIVAQTEGQNDTAGPGGSISLETASLSITGGGSIRTNTIGPGQGGDLTIKVKESVLISGENSNGSVSCIVAQTEGQNDTAGPGGSISLETASLSITGGGSIRTDTIGPGQGGDITINASESITLSDNRKEEISGLYSSSSSSGDAGNISVTTPYLTLNGNTQISSVSSGSGVGGNVKITADSLNLSDSASISVKSYGTGNAGDIAIDTRDTIFLEQSAFTTEIKNADGGNIILTADYMLHLIDSEITTSVGGGSETTGGNISIDPEYVILENSSIIASADEGSGGSIQIVADTLLDDPESLISSSSELEIVGTAADTRSQDTALTGFIAPIPSEFLGAADLLHDLRKMRGTDNNFSLVISGHENLHFQPDGLPLKPAN